MAEIVTVTMVCDRCGSQFDKATFEHAPEYGEMNLQWSGHISGRTWQGDSAGIVHKGKAWLCLACTRDFLAFMKPVAALYGSAEKGE